MKTVDILNEGFKKRYLKEEVQDISDNGVSTDDILIFLDKNSVLKKKAERYFFPQEYWDFPEDRDTYNLKDWATADELEWFISERPGLWKKYIKTFNLYESYKKKYLKEDYNQDTILYHRSLSRIKNFDSAISKEIGLHAGTLEQANSFSGDWLYLIKLNPNKKFIHLSRDTIEGYNTLQFLYNLKDTGKFSESDLNKLERELRKYSSSPDKNNQYARIFRKFLLDRNISGFIYSNEIEGDGFSYCIISPDAILYMQYTGDIVVKLCEKEKGYTFKITDMSYSSVTVKPEKYNGRLSFHTPQLKLVNYNRDSDEYTFSLYITSLQENLKESLSYFNNIDKDIIDEIRNKNIPKNFITNNGIKCSKSAIANLKYLLSKGKNCKLCIGSFVDKDGNATKEVSHVWVEDAKGNRVETGVPSNNKIKGVKKFKSIILSPDDLDRLEKKITKFVKY